MTVTTYPDLERQSAEDVLAYAVERFHPRLYVACSFQKEASVIIDMLTRIEPQARFFTLDTGLLFPETYETWRALEERYGIEIDAYSGITPPDEAATIAARRWEQDPGACCAERKVARLKEALADVDAWVTGVRREQGPTRADTRKLHWDDRHGLFKVNPLADWSERDVWSYIVRHDIPYNPLHDRGYASIGCMPCTSPGTDRDGRWPGSDRTECGLHG
jgi:phosphoadenosine phosphosulfate reductase